MWTTICLWQTGMAAAWRIFWCPVCLKISIAWQPGKIWRRRMVWSRRRCMKRSWQHISRCPQSSSGAAADMRKRAMPTGMKWYWAGSTRLSGKWQVIRRMRTARSRWQWTACGPIIIPTVPLSIRSSWNLSGTGRSGIFPIRWRRKNWNCPLPEWEKIMTSLSVKRREKKPNMTVAEWWNLSRIFINRRTGRNFPGWFFPMRWFFWCRITWKRRAFPWPRQFCIPIWKIIGRRIGF